MIEPRFMQGLGIAFFFTPLSYYCYFRITRARIASALGLSNFFRILGGSFGTSLSVTLWNRREAFHHSRLVEHINSFNPISYATLEQLKSLAVCGNEKY